MKALLHRTPAIAVPAFTAAGRAAIVRVTLAVLLSTPALFAQGPLAPPPGAPAPNYVISGGNFLGTVVATEAAMNASTNSNINLSFRPTPTTIR